MEKFQVKIPCKPYVRRFVELTYGYPADISKDKDLYRYFRSKLQKKSRRYEKRYANLKKYSSEIIIKICVDDFYRYGWDFSASDVIDINITLERKAKTFLYKYVGISWAKVAQKYFGKSSSWMYHKLDGIDGNGNKSDFTYSEKLQLRNALFDFAERIRNSAQSIDV